MVSVGSLCSGYGGLDMALGLPVAWHAENDPHVSRILDHNWPGIPNLGDIRSVDWSRVEPVDWLTAGYPCQPFSSAGKRKGSDDDRHLWPSVAEAIRVLRPRHLLLENVRGHLTLGFDVVLGTLADLGYDARWGVVRASEAGAPHRRERVFVLAADADRAGSDGPGARRGWRPQPADRGDAAADTDGRGREGQRLAQPGGLEGAHRSLADRRTGARELEDAAAAADADRDQPERGGDPGILGAPSAAEPVEIQQRERAGHAAGSGGPDAARWGDYADAIARWECVTGRDAPDATEAGTRGNRRLSATFVEWMMGLPPGHVTDVPGVTRTAQMKALGNGVVVQQARLALRLLS